MEVTGREGLKRQSNAFNLSNGLFGDTFPAFPGHDAGSHGIHCFILLLLEPGGPQHPTGRLPAGALLFVHHY